MLDGVGAVVQEIGEMLAGSFWLLAAILLALIVWTIVQVRRLRRIRRAAAASASGSASEGSGGAEPEEPRAPSWVARLSAQFWWRPALIVIGLAVWVVGSPLAPGFGLDWIGPVILAAGVVAVGAAGRRSRPEE
ncbi:hypothetical protein [Microbacterium stercoris]|uniref:Uncharacterized protein n=1 Tax=Microbacterium stercoris TaxID=2820289 RepID=A0A939QL40_9MICO|nr:hypothetical protein [Microbacterium stercoris]MBO3663672.1 hypothetical protein [Microbacterium stercoris]